MYHTAQFLKLHRLLLFMTSVIRLIARLLQLICLSTQVSASALNAPCVIFQKLHTFEEDDFPLSLEDPSLVKCTLKALLHNRPPTNLQKCIIVHIQLLQISDVQNDKFFSKVKIIVFRKVCVYCTYTEVLYNPFSYYWHINFAVEPKTHCDCSSL